MKVKINKIKCKRCGYEWVPKQEDVRTCANPKCRSAYWDKERNKKNVKKII